MINSLSDDKRKKELSSILYDRRKEFDPTPFGFPFLKIKVKTKGNFEKNLINHQKEVYLRTRNLIHIGYDSGTDLVEMSKKIQEEKEIQRKNSMIAPPKIHIDSPYESFKKKLNIRIKKIKERNRPENKKVEDVKVEKIIENKTKISLFKKKKDTNLFLTNLFSPLSNSMTQINFRTKNNYIDSNNKKNTFTPYQYKKSFSQKNILENKIKLQKLQNIASFSLKKSEDISQNIHFYLDKKNDDNSIDRLNSGKIIEDDSFIHDINQICKAKKEKHLGMKYIKNQNSGTFCLIKQEMANLMNFGDFYYRLEDSLFYKNRKSIYKQYPSVQKAANLKMYSEDDMQYLNENNSKNLHKNQRIIHGLVYKNQKIMSSILSKLKHCKK